LSMAMSALEGDGGRDIYKKRIWGSEHGFFYCIVF
jgi:hypothetical protein